MFIKHVSKYFLALGIVLAMAIAATAETFTSLVSFNGINGNETVANLVQGTDGNLYGTALFGGANGGGTVFKMTPTGTLTTLYSFCSQPNCTDGSAPDTVPALGTDGKFYGVTSDSGAYNHGTVFKITSAGTLTTLHSFDGTDGALPAPGPVQAINGNFYGITYLGGVNGDGTVFKITSAGTLTTLHSFDGTDGNGPRSAVVQATDGNFYGATSSGGANNLGTIFEITSTGTLTTLHSFDGTDGKNARGLVQHTNGRFYGTTRYGGASGDGTVFSLSLGLGPFVKTLPTSGKVGRAVQILGTNLTGATSVSFNGTAATFTVVTGSLISTTVPTGAATGSVQVTTTDGTLTSNLVFRVAP